MRVFGESSSRTGSVGMIPSKSERSSSEDSVEESTVDTEGGNSLDVERPGESNVEGDNVRSSGRRRGGLEGDLHTGRHLSVVQLCNCNEEAMVTKRGEQGRTV